MATSNAGQYAAAAVYYGGSAAPFTRWPNALGGDLRGVNAFMLGKNTLYTAGGLPARPVSAYNNASIASSFLNRVNGGGTTVPAGIGPAPAMLDTSGSYGAVW